MVSYDTLLHVLAVVGAVGVAIALWRLGRSLILSLARGLMKSFRTTKLPKQTPYAVCALVIGAFVAWKIHRMIPDGSANPIAAGILLLALVATLYFLRPDRVPDAHGDGGAHTDAQANLSIAMELSWPEPVFRLNALRAYRGRQWDDLISVISRAASFGERADFLPAAVTWLVKAGSTDSSLRPALYAELPALIHSIKSPEKLDASLLYFELWLDDSPPQPVVDWCFELAVIYKYEALIQAMRLRALSPSSRYSLGEDFVFLPNALADRGRVIAWACRFDEYLDVQGPAAGFAAGAQPAP